MSGMRLLSILPQRMTLIYRVDRRAVGIIFALLFQVLFLGSNTEESAKMMTKGESGRSCVMRCDFLLALPLFLRFNNVNT